MVIVSSSSAKSLQSSKKKAPVGSGKAAVRTSNHAASSKSFARPPPSRTIPIAASAVGGGRGKIKTTRNNTLPLPSPKSGLLNANGPRIHAQRKFAQGASTTLSNSGLSSGQTNYSPVVTPTKDSNKFRKRVLTPISPPLKRPKTEDFLTFLCFRGTPALPPELEFFNFSQPLQVEDIPVQTKRPKESVVSVSTGVGSTNTDNSQNAVPPAVASASSAPISRTTAISNSHVKQNGGLVKASAIATHRNGKQPAKLLTINKRAVSPDINVIRKNGVHAHGTCTVSIERVVAAVKKEVPISEKAAVGKVAKNINTQPPQISPSASRINEHDARFAMTALKLKYQEKRLANARPAKSLITMLTKKVKERSMVLTRSRAKTAVGPLKTSPLQRKLSKPVVRPPVNPTPLPRNAPSPDIILGVAHSPIKPVENKRISSNSESESESEESKKASSSSSESSSSENEEEQAEPAKRSLRSGKAIVVKQSPEQKPAKKSSAPLPIRVGTRSSHRHTKSPLRELPMWNVKKKKILAKYKKNNAKAKAKTAAISKKTSPPTPSHATRSALRKSSGITRGRPSRKTKETAAIHLGILNQDFSSDEVQSSGDDNEDGKSSSSGDTSSSETKFLEKQYNASLKRTSSSEKNDRSSSSSHRLRSQETNKKTTKKETTTKSSSKSKSSDSKSSEKKSSKKPEIKKEDETKPMPRILRSRSGGSVDSIVSKSSSSATERRRLLMMTCEKHAAGAARKSAKIVSRGRRSSGSDSSEEDVEDDDDHDDNNDSGGDDSDTDVDEVVKPNSDSASEEDVSYRKSRSKRSKSGTESPMSISSSRGSRARSKRVTELIQANRSDRSLSSRRSSLASSPVDNKSIRSGCSGSSRSSVKSQRNVKVETEEEEEEEEDDEPVEEDNEDEREEDADDEDDDIIPSPVASPSPVRDEAEVMEDDSNTMVSSVKSCGPSPVSSRSSTSASEQESEPEDEVEEEVPTPPPPPSPPERKTIAIQVDMDLEEEEVRKQEEETKKKEEEDKRLLEKTASKREQETPKVEVVQEVEEDEEEEEEEEDDDDDIDSSSPGTSARTAGIELPLSKEQKAELRKAEEEDDEIQEIGHVINNPGTIGNNAFPRPPPRRSSPSPPIVPLEQPIGPRITNIPPHIPLPTQHPGPIPIPMPQSIPHPAMSPLSTRTSSLTYTSHHINVGGSSAVPFVPYNGRAPGSEFFPPPPLHFGPTHLVNSVHLVGSSTTGHPGVGVDFASELASPLSTLSIPVSVPTLPSFHNSLLPPPPPICLGPGGATMTATSLQTHIRTVATNLDIPLVRPVVGTTDTSLSFAMGIGHQPHQLGAIPLLGAQPTSTFLSRPMWPTPASAAHAAAAAAAAADVRNHYSAFRLPTMQPYPPTSSAPTTVGFKDLIRPPVSSALPLSIVHPRTLPHQQQPVVSQHLSSGAPLLHHLPNHSFSAAHHVVQNIHTASASAASLHQPHLHHQSSSTTTSTASAYMQNYSPESIIRTLPNVSIVPKFDRSSAKTQLPSQKPSSSSSSSSSSKKQGSSRHEEPKKPGKKKSQPSTLPTPSSPLTVRKDSVNPATYVGMSSKSKKRPDVDVPESQQSSSSAHASHSHSHSSSHRKHHNDTSRHSDTSSQNRVIQQIKQERFESRASSSSPSMSSSTSKSASSSNTDRARERSSPAIIPLENIKQEVISVPTPCTSSSSSRKSQSPSVVPRNKNPDRPASSGSADSGGKSHHSEDGKRNERSSKKAGTGSSNKIREAPTFYPTEQEFEDPLKYFDKIQPEAESYGMARIVPPRSFRPECKVDDDMRFTAYNHYIHKMYKRWGPTVHETEAIKEHLKRADPDDEVPAVPIIGGLEIDYSTLYQTVQSFGGLTKVIEKARWTDVADKMHIPKGTHDRTTKLDAVYVKYILPYEVLSTEEKDNLKRQVQEKWNTRLQKLQERTDESSEDEDSEEDSMDELDDCIIKGKGTSLSSYYRVARNTVGMVFPNGVEPPIDSMEEEYWKIVRESKKHLCVYSGSIDCAGVGWGFPAPKPSTKHPWNLKVLANNTGSVLRSMGPVMGATVPTLHVAMLFATYCWYRDPQGLPWIEYLHSGASKIWYSVAASDEKVLRKALLKLMPLQCKNKKLWLPSDSTMVPPELLLENNVPLVRAQQNPGEFLVVFPKCYTSAICMGYLLSESVCFAPPFWLRSCMEMFKDIKDSKEPPVFPIEKLLISIVRDNRVSTSVLKTIAPLVEKVITEELALRKKLTSLGVAQGGKITKETSKKGVSKKKQPPPTEDEVEQCYFCNYMLHMSLVRNDRTDFVTCLHHAIQHLSHHKAQIKKCTLLYEESQDELESLLQTAKRRANS